MPIRQAAEHHAAYQGLLNNQAKRVALPAQRYASRRFRTPVISIVLSCLKSKYTR
jgi:hypothetical protein